MEVGEKKFDSCLRRRWRSSIMNVIENPKRKQTTYLPTPPKEGFSQQLTLRLKDIYRTCKEIWEGMECFILCFFTKRNS